jgi:serine/threonine-protein kinase
MSGRPTSTTTACTRCGGSIYAGDRFCGSCGAVVPVGGPANATPPDSRRSDTPTTTPGNDTPRPDGFTSFDGWDRIVQRLRAATLGEFEIRRELGRGGMAIVFLAHDIALRRKVAIKLMSPGLLTNEEMVRKFREEAVMVAHMSHPNIITIYTVRNVDDLHFFVMKFVEGEPLDQVLRDTGPLPFALARGILYQVGSALAYAHRRGVIHRDVKPANILIDVEGDAVVTDFGIAKATDSDTHTKTGSVVGTPAYMSPEQCYALPATWASDQYSLGVVTYEMIAGVAPFTGPSFVVMKAHADEIPRSIRAVRPDCPPDLDAAVMRMLAKKPEDRFPSIAQALTALGASPLPEGDPRRVDLAALVRKGIPTASLTPVSPIPVWTSEATAKEGEPTAPVPPPAPVDPEPPVTPVAHSASGAPPPEPPPPRRLVPQPDETVRMSPPDESKTVILGPAAKPSATDARTVVASAVPSTPDIDSTTITSPAVRAPLPPPAPPAVAPPNRGRRLGVPVGLVVVASAAVLWFVVLRRPAGPPEVTTSSVTAPRVPDSAASAVVVPPPPPAAVPAPQPATPEQRGTSGSPPTPPISSPNATPTAAPGASTTVAPAPVPARSIAIVPGALTLMVGQTVRPAVTVRGADNQTLAGRRVIWVSPNADVATVDRATGAVTGVSAGTTDVRATSGDARATLRVRVEAPVVLATIAVDQPRRLTVGENITLSAIPRDSRGNVMPDRSVRWSSSDPTVATIVPTTGVVTAIGPGTADLTASADGRTTTVRLSVLAPAPPPPSLPKAESAKAPPVDRAAEEARARAAIEDAVQQYVGALRAHDARRVRSLYRPTSDQDRKNEQALMRLLEGPAKLTAAEPRIGTSRIDGATASVDFSVPMTWHNPFGRIREQTIPFRAELQRDGTEWRLTSSQVAGAVMP